MNHMFGLGNGNEPAPIVFLPANLLVTEFWNIGAHGNEGEYYNSSIPLRRAAPLVGGDKEKEAFTTKVAQKILDKDQCSICLDPWKESNPEELYVTRCSHLFHKICFSKVRDKTSCPLCRSPNTEPHGWFDAKKVKEALSKLQKTAAPAPAPAVSTPADEQDPEIRKAIQLSLEEEEKRKKAQEQEDAIYAETLDKTLRGAKLPPEEMSRREAQIQEDARLAAQVEQTLKDEEKTQIEKDAKLALELARGLDI